MFLYNIRQISNLEEEAVVWRSQVDAHNNPGATTYMKAFFDGLTLGAFSNGDIFAESHKSQNEGAALEMKRISILNRYQDAVSNRNWGLGIGAVGLVAVWLTRKPSF